MYKSIFEEVYTERGVQEGIAKGEQKKAIEIAKNLLSDGIAPEVVARNIGFSTEDVRALLTEI